jgi:hypothetical protein
MFNLSTYKLQVQQGRVEVEAKRKALDEKRAWQEIERISKR